MKTTTTKNGKPTSKPRLKTGTRRTKMLRRGMDVDRVPARSRREAACVLEVLAGLRTPDEAATILEISLPTYYSLETRAVRGLVHGCTPEPPGRKVALEKQLREAHDQCTRLEQQVRRYRALLRTAQRTAGILVEEETRTAKRGSKATKKKAGGRRARQPRVRALRAVEALTTPTATTTIMATADNLTVADPPS